MGFLDRLRKNKGEDKKPIDEYRERYEREDRERFRRERKHHNTERARKLAGGAIKSFARSFSDMGEAMQDLDSDKKPPIARMKINRSMGFQIDTERLKGQGMPKGALDFTDMGITRKRRGRR